MHYTGSKHFAYISHVIFTTILWGIVSPPVYRWKNCGSESSSKWPKINGPPSWEEVTLVFEPRLFLLQSVTLILLWRDSASTDSPGCSSRITCTNHPIRLYELGLDRMCNKTINIKSYILWSLWLIVPPDLCCWILEQPICNLLGNLNLHEVYTHPLNQCAKCFSPITSQFCTTSAVFCMVFKVTFKNMNIK